MPGPSKFHVSLITTCLILVGSSSQARNVIWDISHGPLGDYHLEGRYSQMAELLSQNDLSIEQSESALDVESLWDVDVLAISILSEYEDPFNTSEVERISSFVSGGGGLIIFADNSQVRPQWLVPLLDEFDLFASQRDDIFFISEFGDHPIVQGIEWLSFDHGGAVDVRGDAEIIGWNNDEVPGLAVNEQAGGKVILIGDANIFANQRLGEGDNSAFAVNCFSYADRQRLGQIQVEADDQEYYLLPENNAQYTIEISNRGRGPLEIGVEISEDAEWLSVNRKYATIDINGSTELTVTVNPGEIEPGEQLNAALTIHHNDVESEPIDVQFILHVLHPEPQRFIEPGPTGHNHSLLIRALMIDEREAPQGIEIGVFTVDDFCAGSVVYTGDVTGFPARGDDGMTEEIDGFQNGENFRFKLYIPWDDMEIGAAATFERGPETFLADGLSILTLLGGTQSEITWSLNNRWSTVSLNVLPPYLDFEEIFEPLLEADLLEIVKDGWGNFWNVEFEFSNLGDWNITQGYMVRVAHPTELTIEGVQVNPQTPFRIEFGWSIIGFLPHEAQPVEQALGSIIENLRIIKRDDGAFFVPDWDWDGIGMMAPGKGYHLALTAVDTLIYPELEEGRLVNATPDVRFNPSPSRYNMSLLLKGFEPGGTVIVTGEDGGKTGETVIENTGMAGLPIWGDDPDTPVIEGLREGESFLLKIAGSKENYPVSVEWLEGENKYITDGFAVGKLSGKLPHQYDLKISGFPNPFNNRIDLRFYSGKKGRFILSAFDLEGRSYLEREYLIENPGWSAPTAVDASQMPAGVIIFRLKSSEDVVFFKSVHIP